MKLRWIIWLLIAAAMPGKAEDEFVDVYTVTGISLFRNGLAAPRAKAMAMFQTIGINVRIHADGPPRNSASRHSPPIVIQFEESTTYSGSKDALAFAMPYKDSGTCIHILMDRVTGRNRDPEFVGTLLAHIMVHEITHVLERSVQHASDGVMKARWSYGDYREMKWRPLPFSPEDVECLRQGVARRMSEQHASASRVIPTS